MEFLNPLVESTLRELRDSLRPGRRSSSSIHVTVRGPYRTKPDQGFLTDLGERLAGRAVRVMGAGIFDVPGGFAVFLRAESSAFRELWWKPDFRTPLRDIQPHITVFESPDRASSLLVLNFLRAARISILTYSVQLSVYSAGQKDLFGSRAATRVGGSTFPRDVVAIDPEVLPAATDLGLRLQTGTVGHSPAFVEKRRRQRQA